jgi:hypothetical protein
MHVLISVRSEFDNFKENEAVMLCAVLLAAGATDGKQSKFWKGFKLHKPYPVMANQLAQRLHLRLTALHSFHWSRTHSASKNLGPE